MDQPLTSSDHLGGGGGAVGAEEEAGARVGQEREQEGEGRPGRRLFAFGRGGSAAPSPRGSPAARFGLLTVADIISQDLSTVVWHGSALTVVYLVGGGVWLLISAGWSFTDTVYYMTTSLSTVGYGDVVVRSGDRLLDSLLILLGLVAVTIWATCASRAARTVRSWPAEGPAVRDFDAGAAIRRCQWRLAQRVILLGVVIFVGVLVFMLGEAASLNKSFYWAIVTSSSIGYGDVAPTTVPMRWFTSFYSIVATGSMLATFRCAGAYPFEVWRLRAEGEVYEQFAGARTASERAAAASAVDNAVTELLGIPPEDRPGGTVGRSDVALSMLLLLNRVSYDDVQQATRIFDELGVGGRGAGGPPFPVRTAAGRDRPKPT